MGQRNRRAVAWLALNQDFAKEGLNHKLKNANVYLGRRVK